MKTRVLFLAAATLFSYAFSVFAQGGSEPEEISITTYYPSPFGSYHEVRSDRMAIGDTYTKSQYCWPDETCTSYMHPDADLVVEGRLGIGTVSPGAELEVAGQVKITGGSPGANKVLTSDASGMASWAPASSGVSYTYYCVNTVGTPVCTNAGGSQGYCPAGYQQKLALGSWGRCKTCYGYSGCNPCTGSGCIGCYEFFVPPGISGLCGSCVISSLGQAFVCSQN